MRTTLLEVGSQAPAPHSPSRCLALGHTPSSSLMCVSGALSSPRCPACSEGLPWEMLHWASCGTQHSPSPSFRNAVYSTRRDLPPCVQDNVDAFLRKFSKTWRKGKSPPRGLPASAKFSTMSAVWYQGRACAHPGARGHAGLPWPKSETGPRWSRCAGSLWAVGAMSGAQGLGSACSNTRVRCRPRRRPHRQTSTPRSGTAAHSSHLSSW